MVENRRFLLSNIPQTESMQPAGKCRFNIPAPLLTIDDFESDESAMVRHSRLAKDQVLPSTTDGALVRGVSAPVLHANKPVRAAAQSACFTSESSSLKGRLRKSVPVLSSIDHMSGKLQKTKQDILGYSYRPVPTELQPHSDDGNSDDDEWTRGFIPSGQVPQSHAIRASLADGSHHAGDASICTRCRLRTETFVSSTAFQAFTLLSIIANAIVIGFETDFPEWEYWTPIENGFLFIFTVELSLRLFLAGPTLFFCGGSSDDEPDELRRSHLGEPLEDAAPPLQDVSPSNDLGYVRSPRSGRKIRPRPIKRRASFMDPTARRRPPGGNEEVCLTVVWNIFDFTIVLFGLVDTIADIVIGDKLLGGNVTLFRAIRLLRILRILRVIRILRFLKQLYLLAYGFLEGTLAVFWVTILASCCIYIFSIVLVKTYGRPEEDAPDAEFFIKRFGSVFSCMFTLFEILASPNMAVYRDIVFDYPSLVGFMVFFVVFGSFGISGLLTGVITESIIDKNQARIEEQRQEREQKRRSLETQSGELFDDMVHTIRTEEGFLEVSSKEHNLSIEELLENKENILELFQSNGVSIPGYEFDNMVRAMDFSDSGNIERSEFVHGIVELCEEVRPMSIMELNSQVSRCNVKVENCKSRIMDLESSMQHIGDAVESLVRTMMPSPSHRSMSRDGTPNADQLSIMSQRLHSASLSDSMPGEDSRRLERCEALLLQVLEMRSPLLQFLHVDPLVKTKPQAADDIKPASQAANLELDANSHMTPVLPGPDSRLPFADWQGYVRSASPLSPVQEERVAASSPTLLDISDLSSFPPSMPQENIGDCLAGMPDVRLCEIAPACKSAGGGTEEPTLVDT